MKNDHSPIMFHTNCSEIVKHNTSSGKSRLNFSKPDWPLYKRLMVDFANSLSHKELNVLSIDELNELVLRKN